MSQAPDMEFCVVTCEPAPGEGCQRVAYVLTPYARGLRRRVIVEAAHPQDTCEETRILRLLRSEGWEPVSKAAQGELWFKRPLMQ